MVKFDRENLIYDHSFCSIQEEIDFRSTECQKISLISSESKLHEIKQFNLKINKLLDDVRKNSLKSVDLCVIKNALGHDFSHEETKWEESDSNIGLNLNKSMKLVD